MKKALTPFGVAKILFRGFDNHFSTKTRDKEIGEFADLLRQMAMSLRYSRNNLPQDIDWLESMADVLEHGGK